jgi:hypothetical protein
MLFGAPHELSANAGFARSGMDVEIVQQPKAAHADGQEQRVQMHEADRIIARERNEQGGLAPAPALAKKRERTRRVGGRFIEDAIGIEQRRDEPDVVLGQCRPDLDGTFVAQLCLPFCDIR